MRLLASTGTFLADIECKAAPNSLSIVPQFWEKYSGLLINLEKGSFLLENCKFSTNFQFCLSLDSFHICETVHISFQPKLSTNAKKKFERTSRDLSDFSSQLIIIAVDLSLLHDCITEIYWVLMYQKCTFLAFWCIVSPSGSKTPECLHDQNMWILLVDRSSS